MRGRSVAVVLMGLGLVAPLAVSSQAVVLMDHDDRLTLPDDVVSLGENCREWTACAHLEGISMRTLFIADAVAQAPPGWDVRYDLRDTGNALSLLADHTLCFYGAAASFTRCFDAETEMSGRVPANAHHARIILDQGVDRPWKFKMIALAGNS